MMKNARTTSASVACSHARHRVQIMAHTAKTHHHTIRCLPKVGKIGTIHCLPRLGKVGTIQCLGYT